MIVLMGFFCLYSFSAVSQSIIKEKLFSKILNDTLLFNVWLPYGIETSHNPFPVLYLHNYGALDNYGMNIAAELNRRGKKYPKSVVVEMTGTSDGMSGSSLTKFSYFDKNLPTEGEKYINALKNELFPYVELTYKTSGFRAYLGHSYCATYANWLFSHHPDTFDGYLLFAPESLNTIQEKFEMSKDQGKLYFNKFYWISTGAKDIERRLKFNELAAQRIKPVNGIFFSNQINESADHNSIVDESLGTALSFLFSKYFTPSTLDSTNLWISLQTELKRVKSLYKMKDFTLKDYAYDLYDRGAEARDSSFIRRLAEANDCITNNYLHLFNIGYIYMNVFKDKVSALKYYRKSIDVCLSDNRPKHAFNAYSWMAKIYSDEGNYEKSFQCCEEGFKVTSSYMLLYQASSLAKKNISLIDQSIKYLTEVIKNYKGSDLEIFGVKEADLVTSLNNLKSIKRKL